MDSNLFGTTGLDSCFTQNQFFIENKRMQTKWDIVAYFFFKKKWDFDSDFKWIFGIDFRRDLLRKVFSFKMKETKFKITKYKKQNSKQNKRTRDHKIKFLTTKQTKVVTIRTNHHYFPMASEN